MSKGCYRNWLKSQEELSGSASYFTFGAVNFLLCVSRSVGTGWLQATLPSDVPLCTLRTKAVYLPSVTVWTLRVPGRCECEKWDDRMLGDSTSETKLWGVKGPFHSPIWCRNKFRKQHKLIIGLKTRCSSQCIFRFFGKSLAWGKNLEVSEM